MTFQTTLIRIAIVILAISILIIGIILYRQGNNALYPPMISDCPDYWDINKTTCIKPIINNSSSSKCSNIDFGASPIYKGDNGLCEKQRWAKLCDVTWDGITNNNDLCH